MTDAISHPQKQPVSSGPPLKVLVVTHYYGDHGGGVELIAARLLQELAPRGLFEFTWAASSCNKLPKIEGVQSLPMHTHNLLEKKCGLSWPVWSIKSLWTLRKAVKSTDILWLHDTLYLGNVFAFYVARSRGIPVTITQHLGPIPFRNPFIRWTMWLADKIFSSHMLRNAQEVIFISDRIAEEYYRRVSFIRAIKVIPNGVDIRLFHPPIPENRRFLREQFALKKEQPVLLFVGSFIEKKGLDVIRRLAEKLPSTRFWLVGKGPINPDYWLLPNVHVFHGRKNESLTELYHAADMLLMPSYGEGFPLVIQEAMACGLPVLCGPSTAQGCRPAIPYLHVADLWPENPERTAAVWYEKIIAFPVPLPLATTQKKISDFAQASWDWPPISDVYAGLLKNLKIKNDNPF